MLPPWPLPLRHSHSCLYTRSVFERKKMNCDTVVIHACTRGLSTLQRLQMCSRATIASSTWNKHQLIDNLYSLLVASICCHRGRCCCDTAIYACTRGLRLWERKKMNCDTVVIHACTRGLSFEHLKKNLRPFVRSAPTTHSAGLLLRVGALPCAPTYNRGVVQHVVFNRLGLAHPHECSSKAEIYHANSSATSSNNLYRGRNCCTTHASKATYRYFLGTRLRLPRRVSLERVPTDWYF